MNKHFIIVGAQRSGTTYLYNILNEHPEICMSSPVFPEPKYFLNKPIDRVNIEQYLENHFPQYNCNDFVITGEKSTSYYESEDAARIISQILPSTKIIFLLRNPIYRALSNYFFSCNNGLETRSLEDVFLEMLSPPSYSESISVNPYNYLGRGEYVKFIKMYMKYFPSNQIKILIFEELKDSHNEIEKLYNFLEVSHDFTPTNLNLAANSSKDKSAPSEHIIHSLTQYYAPFNKELEKLINKNITVWK